eukprot:2169521-Rhodomonas_salina.1
MLCPLQPTKPFKYLGCRTTLTLSWRAENEAVLQRTSAEIKRIRMGYTAGIAVVRRSTGNAITKQWWSAHVAAIGLPNGMSRTLLQVGHDRGGWQVTHARVVMWEECETLMQQLAAIDDEAREQLKIDAAEGLQAMGCASMKDAWYEFQQYDLLELTTVRPPVSQARESANT